MIIVSDLRTATPRLVSCEQLVLGSAGWESRLRQRDFPVACPAAPCGNGRAALGALARVRRPAPGRHQRGGHRRRQPAARHHGLGKAERLRQSGAKSDGSGAPSRLRLSLVTSQH